MYVTRLFACHAVAFTLLAVPCAARGAEKPWSRYDNSHFTAYSNAAERRTRGLLEDLEEFRAAFLQVASMDVPQDAPRTVVIITATRREFDQLKTGKHVAGFASWQGDHTVIVMPAQGGKEASNLIRHEYAHALLRYKDFDYPRWYEEGFAEIASSMKLTRRGKSFELGRPPDRATYNGRPVYPWEELFGDDFDPHTFTDLHTGSSAYAQAWIMVHYATLGDRGAHAIQLQRYFHFIRGGEPALDAFRMAFGFAPADAWEAALEKYSRHIPAYIFNFRPGSVDTDFRRRAAEDAEIRPMLSYFERIAVANYRPTPPSDPLAHLDGRWGRAHLTEGCDRALRLTVDRDTQTLAMAEDVAEGVDPVRRYRISQEPGDPDTFLLRPDEATNESEADSDPTMALSLRSPDVACWWPKNEYTRCGLVLVRCPAGEAPPR